MLSRGGFELNEIWAQQANLVEADQRGRELARALVREPGDRESRMRLVAHLRRTGQHDEADHHELAPLVDDYQAAHKEATQAGRDQLGKPHDREAVMAAQAGGRKKGFAHSDMIQMARKHLQRKFERKPDPTGHKVIEDHEIAEHLAKHLNPENTLDHHHLTQQVIDIHGHRDGQGGGTTGTGADSNTTHYKAHALRRRENKPFDLRGPDWETRHPNDAHEREHGRSPHVEALKRSLTHNRAGTVKGHTVHVHHWGEDTMGLHHLTVHPGISGEHAAPVIQRHPN